MQKVNPSFFGMNLAALPTTIKLDIKSKPAFTIGKAEPGADAPNNPELSGAINKFSVSLE